MTDFFRMTEDIRRAADGVALVFRAPDIPADWCAVSRADEEAAMAVHFGWLPGEQGES